MPEPVLGGMIGGLPSCFGYLKRNPRVPTLSGSILPQLPFLRRFARALAGSQKSGDAYVASVLEALIADTSLFPKDLPPRCALYQVFLKTWDSVSVNHGAAPLKEDTLPGTIDMRLEAIAPRPRQAFLLVATEGFSHAEAAQISRRGTARIPGFARFRFTRDCRTDCD